VDAGQLAHRFAYHPPSSPAIAGKHEDVRAACGALGEFLNDLIDQECREKAVALTHLEEVMMWANAAIARELNYRAGAGPEMGDSPDLAAARSAANAP